MFSQSFIRSFIEPKYVAEHFPQQSMCTFDKGMCGWRDLPSDQFEHFDWTRHKGPSSTKGTGPPFDHTNGTLEGKI